MNTIKLEVPADNMKALKAAAGFFNEMAGEAVVSAQEFTKAVARLGTGAVDEPVIQEDFRGGEFIVEQDVLTDPPAIDKLPELKPLTEPQKIDAAFEGTIDGSSLPPVFDGVEPLPVIPVTEPLATNVSVAPTEPELDAHGLPWDKRIHSSNHKKYPKNQSGDVRKIKDGWMIKKNLPQTLWDKVVAELKGASPVAPVAPVAEPSGDTPLAWDDVLELMMELTTSGKIGIADNNAMAKQAGLEKPRDAMLPENYDKMVTYYGILKDA